jgi:hypothetical protein
MAVVFSVADGGFIQDVSGAASKLDFAIKGNIENPNLVDSVAPVYVSGGFTINSATLAITNGVVGDIKIEIRSSDPDGTNSVTHVTDTISVISGGQAWGLTIGTAAIGSTKVVKLYTQYLSGGVSSDISVTLE